MPAEIFEIAYVAQTAACTFLLDADGICRHVVMSADSKRRDPTPSATRCIGAQYVASLDPLVAGCLVDMPRAGVSMLFARTDPRGRISLVRTGVVSKFEVKREDGATEDPFDSSSWIKTSAPLIVPSETTRRDDIRKRNTTRGEPPTVERRTSRVERHQPVERAAPPPEPQVVGSRTNRARNAFRDAPPAPREDDPYDATEQTQRFNSEHRRALARMVSGLATEPLQEDLDEASELRTSEWQGQPPAPRGQGPAAVGPQGRPQPRDDRGMLPRARANGAPEPARGILPRHGADKARPVRTAARRRDR